MMCDGKQESAVFCFYQTCLGYSPKRALKEILWVAVDHLTDQSTQEIHSLQNQFLVSNPWDTQVFKVLVRNLQQLFTIYLLPFEFMDILLQAIIQA